MSLTLLNDETLEYIIEGTITECNRVLHNWKLNKKPIGFNDKVSLFRSYLAEFFKRKFGFGAYHRFIRIYDPLVVIDNYKVVSIDFNISKYQYTPNVYLQELDRYCKNMDILKFSELQSFDDVYPKILVVSDTIDYEKITNIKFS